MDPPPIPICSGPDKGFQCNGAEKEGFRSAARGNYPIPIALQGARVQHLMPCWHGSSPNRHIPHCVRGIRAMVPPTSVLATQRNHVCVKYMTCASIRCHDLLELRPKDIGVEHVRREMRANVLPWRAMATPPNQAFVPLMTCGHLAMNGAQRPADGTHGSPPNTRPQVDDPSASFASHLLPRRLRGAVDSCSSARHSRGTGTRSAYRGAS